MDKLIINGGNKLSGEVFICGSKNAVLHIMTATLIVQGTYKIGRFPRVGGGVWKLVWSPEGPS